MSSNTKILISNAFFDLALSKSIDKITVKDIVENCGITRQTFYYHFQDIMDVIEWSLQQKMNEVLDKSLKAPSMIEAIKILASLLSEHPDFINKLLNSQKREQTERLLISTVRSYLQEMIEKKELFMDMKRSDVEISKKFFSYAIVGTLIETSQNRKNMDLDVVTEQICRLITGEMFAGKAL